MAKNNNKGFSLVEVIMAVAVFAILVVPVTSQLITSMNINTTSTKKQYAVDKAEEVMESFKTVSLGGDVNIADGNTSGNYVFSLTNTDSDTISISGVGNVGYNVQTYTCDSISLGESYEKYTCTVEISDLAYQVSALGYTWIADEDDDDIDAGDVRRENGTPVESTSAVGTVRNLDNSQVAVIAGATYKSGATSNSLDVEAYEELLTTKVSLLQTNYPLEYNQYLSGSPVFSDGMFEKHTTISVDYDSTLGMYTVSCSVSYVDSSGFRLDNVYVDGTTNVYNAGTVYTKQYSELPPIYLLYTPATYNGKYVNSDYIYVETSNLPADEDIVLYVFETNTEMSDTYKEIIKSALGVSSVDDLIYSSSYTRTYTDVKTYLLYSDETCKATNVTAYSNFTITEDTTSDLNIACQDTTADVSDEVYYYDMVVTLTDSEGNETIIKGTRGN